MTKETITEWFMQLQDRIFQALEAADGKEKFLEEHWEREEGGGGRSRVMVNGGIIEKGGVNFSAVHGPLPEKISSALNLKGSYFYATGVSIVIHPFNPHIPTIHMNVRYFEMNSGEKWFGGGIDLTPYYINIDDVKFFHSKLKEACDKHDLAYYKKFKAWADDYFFIKHRNETRGVGGIFFDRLTSDNNHTLEDIFELVKSVGDTFVPVYTALIRKNSQMQFTEQEKQWQLIRRGRYVEFNLVYDKGTKFGLDTDGRIESILMSLPLYASWPYNFKSLAGSKEEEMLRVLKKGIEWVA